MFGIYYYYIIVIHITYIYIRYIPFFHVVSDVCPCILAGFHEARHSNQHCERPFLRKDCTTAYNSQGGADGNESSEQIVIKQLNLCFIKLICNTDMGKVRRVDFTTLQNDYRETTVSLRCCGCTLPVCAYVRISYKTS